MMIAYRVILDEPVGVCLGFDPQEASHAEVEADEFSVEVENPNADRVWVNGSKMWVGEHAPSGDWHEEDLLVWRTPEDFRIWTDETLG